MSLAAAKFKVINELEAVLSEKEQENEGLQAEVTQLRLDYDAVVCGSPLDIFFYKIWQGIQLQGKGPFMHSKTPRMDGPRGKYQELQLASVAVRELLEIKVSNVSAKTNLKRNIFQPCLQFLEKCPSRCLARRQLCILGCRSKDLQQPIQVQRREGAVRTSPRTQLEDVLAAGIQPVPNQGVCNPYSGVKSLCVHSLHRRFRR